MFRFGPGSVPGCSRNLFLPIVFVGKKSPTVQVGNRICGCSGEILKNRTLYTLRGDSGGRAILKIRTLKENSGEPTLYGFSAKLL